MRDFKPSGCHYALAAVLGALLVPLPALAQHAGHAGMQMPMPAPAPSPDKRSVDQKKKPTASVPVTQAPVEQATPPAASTQDMPMDHSAMGHDMGTMDTGGMTMPMDHGAMNMSAPTQPRTPIPALTDADRAAAEPPPADHPVHDNTVQSYVLFDRLEGWSADPGTGLAWEGQAWFGTDLNRLWLRSEGEQVDGRLESADLEVLYGHSFSPWWDVVTGVRHDFKPGGAQDFAAIGVMGLAPYKFEVAATAYLGQGGQTAARLEAEYETLFTNRLILQERVEANLYGKDDPRRGIGSGLSTFEAGLRLRYEFTRRFAPYIGIVHERAFGGTADLRRAEHESTEDTRIVAGLRLWF
ncbi:copper resistance protein B [Cognatiluteimonas sedimenti]